MDVQHAKTRLLQLDAERTALLKLLNAGHAMPAFDAEWINTAMEYARRFVSEHKGQLGFTFLAADVRVWATDRGCPIPRSLRAWAPVVLRMEREGLIRREGYGRPAYEHDPYASENSGHQFTLRWRIA